MTDAPETTEPVPRKSPDPEPPHTLASWEALLSTNTLDILKNLAGSKTVIGVLILLVNNLFLKDAPIDEAIGDQVHTLLTQALDLIGGVVAVWGRLTAKGPLIQNAVK